jgi:hypothetical protein
MSTLGLIVCSKEGLTSLVDILTEDQEIHFMEQVIQERSRNPLKAVYDRRAEQDRKDEEFGDYVEKLLTRPSPKSEIHRHCIQWLQSKAKIEEYLKNEREAAEIIAGYAVRIYESNREKRDFILVSQTTRIRIRIFEVTEA